MEGKYLIQTEEPNFSAPQAVEIYKELSEVERAFAELKDVIEMRPIYHQKASRVQAHIFVASLVFLVDRALEKKLKSAGLDLSSKQAWQILKTVRVVEIELGHGELKRSVTQVRRGLRGYCGHEKKFKNQQNRKSASMKSNTWKC